MVKHFVMTAAFLLPVLLGRASAQAPSGDTGQYRISTNVDLVVLDVAVFDRQGHYVRDLTKDNFEVLEDGRLQSIALFRNEDIPVAAGVIVDSSGSMGPKRAETIASALAFLRASNPEDDIFVVNFNERVALGLPPDVRFTADPELLRAALSRMPIGGRTALYDAIAAGLEQIRQSRYRRKFLIVFSDGGDNESRRTLDQITRAVQESEVTIYTIGLFDSRDPDRNPGVLKKLAHLSGGQAYLPAGMKDVPDVCRRIASDIRSRYIIGYTPSRPGKDDEFHGVEVRVHAPGSGRLDARTRTGYRVLPFRLQAVLDLTQFKNIDSVERPTVRTGNSHEFALAFRQRNIKALLSPLPALHKKLHAEGRLARTRIALNQIKMASGKSTQKHVVQPGDAGRHADFRIGRFSRWHHLLLQSV
jgi:VWFA-related protein